MEVLYVIKVHTQRCCQLFSKDEPREDIKQWKEVYACSADVYKFG